jgi:hypothetical protein
MSEGAGIISAEWKMPPPPRVIKLQVMSLNAKYVQSETKFMHKLPIV